MIFFFGLLGLFSMIIVMYTLGEIYSHLYFQEIPKRTFVVFGVSIIFATFFFLTAAQIYECSKSAGKQGMCFMFELKGEDQPCGTK